MAFRTRVAVAWEDGETVPAAAKRFGVSVASVVRIGQWPRAGRGLIRRKIGRHRRPVLTGVAGDWLLPRLAENSDLTMRKLTAELAARGVHLAHDTVWRFVKRAGQSAKKTLMASAQVRPKVARVRAPWRAHQHRLDPRRLIFIGEIWIRTNTTRACGWAARGKRLTAHVPHGHGNTLTFLAGLRHDRIVAPFVLDGPVNGAAFTARVCQCLAPTLTPGDVVIADNPGSHKGLPARQLIRTQGRV